AACQAATPTDASVIVLSTTPSMRNCRVSALVLVRSMITEYVWYPVWQVEPAPGQGISACPGLFAESCSVWDASLSALTSSIRSTSRDGGRPPPAPSGPPRPQTAGQCPRPFAGFGCWTEAVISSLPPAGAWKSSRVLSIRPDVHVPPLLIAFSTRCPLPSRYTL